MFAPLPLRDFRQLIGHVHSFIRYLFVDSRDHSFIRFLFVDGRDHSFIRSIFVDGLVDGHHE